MIARRGLLAVAAVVDIALHARGKPVAGKELAARLGLAPRHLETLLRELVRAGILKATRGPRGGYALARERRRISVGAILRALDETGEEAPDSRPVSGVLDTVVLPAIEQAWAGLLERLDDVTVQSLLDKAGSHPSSTLGPAEGDDGFVI